MAAQDQAQTGSEPDAVMVPLKFLVPPAWKAALTEAAKTQGLSVGALCRLVLGGFLRNRLNGTGA